MEVDPLKISWPLYPMDADKPTRKVVMKRKAFLNMIFYLNIQVPVHVSLTLVTVLPARPVLRVE